MPEQSPMSLHEEEAAALQQELQQVMKTFKDITDAGYGDFFEIARSVQILQRFYCTLEIYVAKPLDVPSSLVGSHFSAPNGYPLIDFGGRVILSPGEQLYEGGFALAKLMQTLDFIFRGGKDETGQDFLGLLGRAEEIGFINYSTDVIRRVAWVMAEEFYAMKVVNYMPTKTDAEIREMIRVLKYTGDLEALRHHPQLGSLEIE